eukprot:gene5782-6366_t
MILRATLLLTFIICASIAYKANNGRPLNFTIPLSYDFSHSTEDNYAKVDASFVGKYGEIRSTLDYNYHKMYSEERQLFQDRIVDLLLETKIKDHRNNEITCEITAQRWAVFTAGPMGVGKGYTLRWLHRENIFPIEAFVYVDPDVVRFLLPESYSYNEMDQSSMGYLTQKEVGYIAEVLTQAALIHHKNVLVDGSLRDALWYSDYFQSLRKTYPQIKIAILHVMAPLEKVLKRSRLRAVRDGRSVPDDWIAETAKIIPHSVAALAPLVDFHAELVNDDEVEIRLDYYAMRHTHAKDVIWKVVRKDKQQYHFVDHINQLEEMESDWMDRLVTLIRSTLDYNYHKMYSEE